MTGSKSFAALNTAGKSLSNSTPKTQVLFALPTEGDLPAKGVRGTAADVEEKSTSAAVEEGVTAAKGSTTAPESVE